MRAPVLLRDWQVLHGVMLFLDVYAVVFVVALHAASVVRPHVLDAVCLRVRRAVHVDLRIPLERIATVRHELVTTHGRADGELNLPVGSQTSVTLELTEPVAYFTLFGRRREVCVVRVHVDDADRFVRAVVPTGARGPSPGDGTASAGPRNLAQAPPLVLEENPCSSCCRPPKARRPRGVAPR